MRHSSAWHAMHDEALAYHAQARAPAVAATKACGTVAPAALTQSHLNLDVPEPNRHAERRERQARGVQTGNFDE